VPASRAGNPATTRDRRVVKEAGRLLSITARLRHVLGRELAIDPHSIHAQVIGEHGDSEVVLWSTARIGGLALRRWPVWTREWSR